MWGLLCDRGRQFWLSLTQSLAFSRTGLQGFDKLINESGVWPKLAEARSHGRLS